MSVLCNRCYKGVKFVVFRFSVSRAPAKSPGGLTNRGICARFYMKKAVTKTRIPGKNPREASIWCKDAVPLPGMIPLPSRMCGNAMPGAPVKASMSGGVMYTATRVEPWNT